MINALEATQRPELLAKASEADFELAVERVRLRCGGAGQEGYSQALFKDPVVRAFLTRANVQIDAGARRVIISRQEQEVLGLLASRIVELNPGFEGSNVLNRMVEGGDVQRMLGVGTGMGFRGNWKYFLREDLSRVRSVAGDISARVHPLSAMSIGELGQKLVDVVKCQAEGISLAEGVNYLPCYGRAYRERWGGNTHDLVYIGVVVKDEKGVRVVCVMGMNSWVGHDFEREEQDQLKWPIVWCNQYVQYMDGDGSCSYYTLEHLRGFLGLLIGKSNVLDEYVLALDEDQADSSESTVFEREMRVYVVQEMKRYLPQFFEAQVLDSAFHWERGTAIVEGTAGMMGYLGAVMFVMQLSEVSMSLAHWLLLEALSGKGTGNHGADLPKVMVLYWVGLFLQMGFLKLMIEDLLKSGYVGLGMLVQLRQLGSPRLVYRNRPKVEAIEAVARARMAADAQVIEVALG